MKQNYKNYQERVANRGNSLIYQGNGNFRRGNSLNGNFGQGAADGDGNKENCDPSSSGTR